LDKEFGGLSMLEEFFRFLEYLMRLLLESLRDVPIVKWLVFITVLTLFILAYVIKILAELALR